ncbi:MAG TPA: HEAT repeat domain-containing protein [Kofleriaceae bacterium]|nr:HEAT repeat domain-containing protein [Kofleriaceae bacterium]
MRLLVVAALAGCGSSVALRAAPPRPAPAALAAPAAPATPAAPAAGPAIEAGARGADYLGAVATQLEPRWGAFVDDCRLRLPASHPLNAMTLAATFELAVGRDGRIVERRALATSGNRDFDAAIGDVLADASPLPAPPVELVSDDERVHLRWQFARDPRRAGPATARVVRLELPLPAVIDGLLGRGEVTRAARRIAEAPDTAPRAELTGRVMIAALREALAGPDSAARRAAVEACGRARVGEFAGDVRALLATTTDPELRRAAIATAAALGDRAAAPALAAALPDDLAHDSRTALARVAALVAIGQAAAAARAVSAALDAGPSPAAIAALGAVPAGPAIGRRLAAWSTARDPAIRGAVCAALPGAAPASAAALIRGGLRDADATVRAACAEAAGRAGRALPDPATLRRLRELARDRDRSVRARAVAAVAAVDPMNPVRAAGDPAPEVRAAFAAAASEPELAALVADPDPEVRAAALVALGERASEVALRAAGDPSAVVRRAAAAVIADPAALSQLAGDDTPEVATAALVRRTALAGRAGATSQLLERLADAPPASPERARIALAWLLAS